MPLKKAALLFPSVITVGTTVTPLFPGWPEVKAFWVLVRVRSIGTATYVAIGNNIVQPDRFIATGASQVFDVPDGYYFDAAQLVAISDTADAVIEVTGAFEAGEV